MKNKRYFFQRLRQFVCAAACHFASLPFVIPTPVVPTSVLPSEARDRKALRLASSLFFLLVLFTAPAFAKDFEVKNTSNSFFYVSGNTGNVGVFNASPAATLDVNGGVKISGDVTIGAAPSTTYATSSADLFVKGNIENDGTIYSLGANASYFAGNIGIGTTAPAAKLEVDGAVYAPAGTGVSASHTQVALGTAGNAMFGRNVEIDGALYVDSGIYFTGALIGDGSRLTGIQVASSTVNAVPKSTGSTLVDSGIYAVGSNIGIGTTAPTAGFQIGPGTFTFATGTTSEHLGGNLETDGQIYSMGTGFNVFAGNVGIGTTNPTALLQVHGNIRTPQNSRWDFWTAGAVSDAYAQGGGHAWIFNSYYNDATFSWTLAETPTTLMTLNSSGLGIGTTTPDAALSVMRISSGNTIANFGVAGSSSVVIDQNGNVGIGTISPTYKLKVNGTGYFNSFVDINGALSVSKGFNSSGAAYTSTFTGGNVGIGTTTPWARAQIDGALYVNAGTSTGPSHPEVDLAAYGNAMFGRNVEIDGALYVDSGIYFTGALVGDGSRLTGIQVASSTANAVPKSTGSTQVDSGIYAVGSNIGIGTTAPSAGLQIGPGTFSFASGTTSEHIGGNLEADGQIYSMGTGFNVFAGNVGIGTTNPAALIDIQSSSGSGNLATISNTSTWGYSGTVLTVAAGKGAGTALNVTGGAGTGVAELQTGSLITGTFSHFSTAGSYTQAGNILNLSRTNAGNTLTITGALATMSDNFTSGYTGVVHSADVLDLFQNYSLSTGIVLKAVQSGTGPVAVLMGGNVGIGTTTPWARAQVDGALYVNAGTSTGPSHPEVDLAAYGNAMFGRNVEIDGALYVDSGIYFTGALVGDGSRLTGIPVASSTVNAVPKSTGFTLVDSGIYAVGGNVGIGTTAPNAALSVMRISSGNTIANFGVAGSSSVIIDQNGNVGIMTATPGYPLDVNGVVRSSSSVVNVAPFITSNTNTGSVGIFSWVYEGLTPNIVDGSGSLFLLGKAKSTNNSTHFDYVHAGTGSLSNRFSIGMYNNDNLLNVLASGNVGIGTTTPAAKLEVDGAVYAPAGTGVSASHAQVALGTAGNAMFGRNVEIDGALYVDSGIYFTGSLVGDGSRLTGIPVASSTVNAVPKSTGSTLVDSGIYAVGSNIGVGVATPGYPLELVGGGSAVPGTNVSLISFFYQNAPNYKGIGLGYDSTSQTGVIYSGGAPTAVNSLAFYTVNGSGGAEKLRITATGNVGIGTSTPTAQLQVMTTSGGTTLLAAFGVAGSNSVVIDKNGNVGIGTTVPISKVEVNGGIRLASGAAEYSVLGQAIANVPAGGTIFANNATDDGKSMHATAGSMAMQYVDGYFAFHSAPATAIGVALTWTERFRLSNTGGISLGSSYVGTNPGAGSMIISGNLGIGTTAPAAKLEVDGALYAPAGTGVSASHAEVVLGTAGNAMFGRNVEIDGALYVDSGIYFTGALVGDGSRLTGIPVASSTANAVPKSSGSSLVDSGIYALSNGNVGIGGIIAPGAALEVGGSAIFGGSGDSFFSTNVGVGSSSPTARLQIAGVGTTTATAFQVTDSSYAARVTVLDGGNVGIGISAPAAKLEVDGAVYAPAGTGVSASHAEVALGTAGNAMFGRNVEIDGALYVDSGIYFTGALVGDGSRLTGISSSSTIISDLDTSVYVIDGNATPANSRVGFNINGSTSVIIDQNGNVGIGTTSPTAQLYIKAVNNATVPLYVYTATAQDQYMAYWNHGNEANHYVSISGQGTLIAGGYLGFGGSGSLSQTGIYNTGGSDFLFNLAGNITMTAGRDLTNASITLTPKGTGNVIIDSGNVGIGTSAPGAKLEVDGAVYAPAGTGVSVSHAQVAMGTAGNAMFGRNVEIDGALYVDSGIYFTGALVGDGSRLTGIPAASSTANAVPKSSGSSLVDSGIYAVGSNIGIGTTAPSAGLQIGPGTFSFASGTTSEHIGGNLEADGQIYSMGTGFNVFAGNVGIGTVAPQASLHVFGGLKVTGTASNYTDITIFDGYYSPLNLFGTKLYKATDSGSIPLRIATQYNSSTWRDNVIFGHGQQVNAPLFGVYGGAVIGANYTGNYAPPTNGLIVEGYVGIGTGSPAAKLEVDGAIYVNAGTAPSHSQLDMGIYGNAMFGRNVEIDGALYVDSGIYFTGALIGDGSRLTGLANGTMITQNDTTVAIADGDNAPIKFSVDGSTSVVIDHNGNIGIGTILPTALLDVNGGFTARGASYIIPPGNAMASINLTSTGGSGSKVALGDSGTYSAGIVVGSLSGGDLALFTNTTGKRIYMNGSGTVYLGGTITNWDGTGAKMGVLSAGNVGIGTMLPRALFEVAGGATITGDVTIGPALTTYATPNADLFVQGNFETDGSIYSLGANANYFAGCVGVGTTAPAEKLHVQTAANSVGLTIRSPGASENAIQWCNGSSCNYMALGVDGGLHFGGTPGGIGAVYPKLSVRSENVGIGTLAPTAKLQVMTTSGGTTLLAAFGVAASNSVVIDSNGNVGVGTTAPGAKLEVDGAVYAPAGTGISASHAEVALGTAGNAMFGRNVEIDGALYVDSGIYFTGALVGDGSRLTGISTSSTIISDLDTSVYVIDGNGTPANSRVGFNINGSTSVIIDQNGNVGIGTTSPVAGLHVIKTTELLRLGYDASNYLSATVDSTGGARLYNTGTNKNLVISTNFAGTGGTVAATFGFNPYIINGLVTPALGIGNALASLSQTGNGLTVTGYDGITFTSSGDTGSTMLMTPGYRGGYLGIGTTNPGAKLHVVGTGTTTGRAFEVDNSLYNSKFIVLDSGNVGVGTTAPAAALSVMRISSGNTIANFGVAGSSSVIIDQNGNVGIGISTPSKRFDISSGGSAGNDYVAIQSNQGRGITFYNTSPMNASTYQHYISNNFSSGLSYLNYMSFYVSNTSGGTNGNNEVLRLMGSQDVYIVGNVGINTVTPAAKLEVDGAVYAPAGTGISASHAEVALGTAGNAMFGRNVEIDGALYVDSGIYFTGALVGDGSRLTGISTSSTIISDLDTSVYVIDGNGNPANSRVGFNINGSTSVIIDQNGNVGMGSTGPGAKLDVNGSIKISSSTGQLIVPVGTASIPSIGFSNSTGVSGIYYVDGAGNDTIVTKIAGFKVYEMSLFAIQQAIQALNIAHTGATLAFNSDGSLSRLAANKLAIGNGSAGDYSGTLIVGNVGIGTSAPAARLEVDGAVYAPAGTGVSVSHAQVALGTAGNAMFGRNVEIDGALYVDSGIYFTGALVGDGSRLTGLANGTMITQNDTTVAIVDGDNAPIKFSVDGSTSVVIDHNGNVGIGSSAPDQALQIVGNIHLGSNAADLTTRNIYQASNRYISLTSAGLDVTNWYSNGANFWHKFGFNGKSTVEMFYDGTVSLGNTTSIYLPLRLKGDPAGENTIGSAQHQYGANIRDLRLYTGDPYSTSSGVLNSANIIIQTGSGVNGGTTGVIKFEIGASGSERMRIHSTGNVGIGTSAPAAKLEVDGAVYAPAGTGISASHAEVALGTAGNAMFGGNVEIDGFLYIDGALYGDGSGLTGIPGSVSGLTANAVPRASTSSLLVDSGIYVLANGNVGIGTTNPGQNLEVYRIGAGNVLKLSSSLSGSGYAATFSLDDLGASAGLTATANMIKLASTSGIILAGNVTANFNITQQAGYNGYLHHIHNSSYGYGLDIDISGSSSTQYPLRVTTETTIPLLLVTAAGNVGIGTIAPAAKFEVDGAIYAASGVAPSHSQVSLATAGHGMFGGNVEIDGALYVDSGIYFTGALVGDGSRLTGISSSSTIISDLDTNVYVIDGNATPANSRVGFNINGSTSVIIDQNGNVGIGTASPGKMLDLYNGATSEFYVSSAGGVFARSSLLVPYLQDIGNGYERIYLDAANNALKFNTGTSVTTERMRIDNAGNVGIGTTAPNAALSVMSTSSAYTIANFGVAGSSSIVFDKNGNVGIGTTDALSKLNVNGGFGSATGITFGNGDTGFFENADNDLYVKTAGTNRWHLVGARIIGASAGVGLADTGPSATTPVLEGPNDTNTGYGFGGADTISLITNGSEKVRVQSDGNVGIGTSLPLQLLHVEKNQNASTFFFVNNTTNGTGASSGFEVDAAANGVGAIVYPAAHSTRANMAQFYSAGNADNFNFASQATTGYFTFYTKGGISTFERMRISTEGNVGIGTVSPGATLDVKGTIIATSFGNTLDKTPDATMELVKDGTTDLIQASSLATTDGDLFVVKNSGNVGIGTTTPWAKLQVDGAVYANAGVAPSHAQVALGTAGNAMFGRNVEIDGALYVDSGIYFTGALIGDGSQLTGILSSANMITQGDTTVLVTDSGTDGNVVFKINGSNSVVIDRNGNVGIGTTAPTSMLELPGKSTTSSLKVGTLEYQSFGTNNAWIADNMYNNGTNFIHRALGSAGLFYFQGTEGQYRFYVPRTAGYSEGTGQGATVQLKISQTGEFGVGSGINNETGNFIGSNFYVSASGNVGIGTTAPGAGLQIGPGTFSFASGTTSEHIGGNLEVDGALYANTTVTFSAEYSNGNSGASKTVDWHNGNKQVLTLTATCTLSFTAPGGVANLMLRLVQGGAGSFDINWPSNVKWPSGGVKPTLSTAAGSVDIVSCYYNAVNYYCSGALNFQ